jgi:hypothetical protein
VHDRIDPHHPDLNDLRKEQIATIRENLDFSYNYLNFYTGLNSAILAATLAGLLKVDKGDKRALLLIAGSALVIALSRLGYVTVKVFYRRFVEAWITVLNLERMLKLGSGLEASDHGFGEPRYPSRYGGFMARYERAPIYGVLRQADDESADAETVVERVTSKGDTLRYCAITFSLLSAIAIVFAFASMLQAIS